jgi:hypothetical protein
MKDNVMLPDLQGCVLCEDVRCEFNGMQTLVGVVNVIPAQALPVNCLRSVFGPDGAAVRGDSVKNRASSVRMNNRSLHKPKLNLN